MRYERNQCSSVQFNTQTILIKEIGVSVPMPRYRKISTLLMKGFLADCRYLKGVDGSREKIAKRMGKKSCNFFAAWASGRKTPSLKTYLLIRQAAQDLREHIVTQTLRSESMKYTRGSNKGDT